MDKSWRACVRSRSGKDGVLTKGRARGSPQMKRLGLFLAIALACAAAHADDYYQQMNRLKELDQACERARAIKLAPVREQYFQDCVKDRHKTRQDCELEAKVYGETTIGPNRNPVKGLHYDLPECQQAAAAWQAWEKSRPGIR